MVRGEIPYSRFIGPCRDRMIKQGSSLNGIDCSDRTAEPIDVLEVDGKYYGFSGHRFEACQRLGKETILARVRKAPRAVLKMHLPEEMPVT